MTSIKITQNDTVPLSTQLRWGNGDYVDLSAASSVKFLMMEWGSVTAIVSGDCTIVTANEGIVRYTWGIDETSTNGFYRVQWEITYTDGTTYTVPTDKHEYLLISGDLG